MAIGHTGCHRGKRVLVHLKKGKPFEDVFESRNDREIFLKGAGKISKKLVRSVMIIKEQTVAA